MIKLRKKIAVLSNILPPEPSGQSVLIHRLLSEISPESYCLISRKDYNKSESENQALEKLPAPYYHITHKLNRNYIANVFRRKKCLLEILKKENCEILIAFSGDLYDIPAAYLAAKELKIKFIPYMADWYSYQWIDNRQIFSKIAERFIIGGAAISIVPNEFLANELKKRYKVKTAIVRNMIPLPDLHKIDATPEIFDNNEISIAFTGAIYQAQFDAFRNLIAALKLLNDDRIKLHIYTSCKKEDINKEGIGGSNVIFHDYVNESEVARILRKSDILFLPLGFRTPYPKVINTSAPGKMGEYMAVGKPILVHSPNDSFVSWYHRKNGTAQVVSEEKVESLAHSIKELIDSKTLCQKLGDSALKFATEDFELIKNQKRFVNIINSLS